MSPSDVENFITTRQKPDCSAVMCSTLLVLEDGLRNQGMSVAETLPELVSAIDSSVQLPSPCRNILHKIWKKVEGCKEEGLDNLLKMPVSQIYQVKGKVDPNKVGEECEKHGVTLHVLKNGFETAQDRVPLTKMMAAEIETYREKTGKSFDEVKGWLERVLGQDQLKNVNSRSLQLSLKGLKKKVTDLRRRSSGKEKLRQLCEEPYIPPTPQAQVQPQVDEPGPSSHSRSSLGKWEAALQDRKRLEGEVKQKELDTKELLAKQSALEQTVARMKRKSDQDEKLMRKKQRLLEERETKVKEKESQVKMKNVKQKYRRKDNKISQLTEDKADLSSKCSNLQTKVTILLKDKERQRNRLKYYRMEKSKIQKELKELRKKDKAREKEMSRIQAQVEDLQAQLEEKEHTIKLRDGPYTSSPFTADVRACYMELVALEVSARNMSKVVHSVLTTLGKFNVELKDFPGETFSQLVRLEADLVSSIQAAQAVSEATNATLQSDSTSRDGVKFTGFQANTAKGRTETIGCLQVPSGESADQLEAFKFLLHTHTH
ncbi:PREDICTED: myosin heavy chain, striated muscle-like isoform X2 [Branchiostoma belcheri]|uniref:Myosin heavy chain, striated muscle-like isoform X2 n=1 Tax=Branchiostoma belcheri TaxID=7741 RepID=A0A6P4Y5E1_BRABE|nr:PREDICTED: myosin heavy chain, striated muscle-like isoform X2 [Branchiostoma belcheri]